MNAFKERLVIEKDELETKLDKLDEFLQSDKVSSVSTTQKVLLNVQSCAMNTYLQCLKERLETLD